MSILKKLWTKQIGDSEVKTTYRHVVDLQDRIERTYDIAQRVDCIVSLFFRVNYLHYNNNYKPF